MLTQEFIDFFTELEQNNHKEWFDENRKRYEKHVKNPVKELATVFINELLGEEAFLKNIQPKDCLFRINRDIRFSKDKTPYKTHIGMVFSKYGKKDAEHPSMYLEISAKHVRLYSGSYSISKDGLKNIREKIYENPQAFLALVEDKDFVKHFGKVLGERNKRIPKPWNELEESCPYIFNKNFYYFKEYPAKVILQKDFISTILQDYQFAEPMNSFLLDAIGE